jgi:magnesium-transporting ATPase (P-type)
MFIFTGVFTCFTARTKRVNLLSGIGKNPGFLTIMALISIMQISFVYFGGEALRCVPLRLDDLGRVILISLSVVVFDFTGKLIKKLFYKGEKKCQKRNTIPRAG